MSDNASAQSPLSEATSIMLEAMRNLKEKKIDAKEAASFALLGHSVIEAAREITAFAKVTGYLPSDSVYGSRLQPLEPQVTQNSLDAQAVRLNDGMRAIEVQPVKKSRKDENPWINSGEFV